MVVAALPGTEASIAGELDLIKAALLYGDEVTLLSPATTMFLGVEEWGGYSMIEQMKLLRQVAHLLVSKQEADELIQGLDSMEAALAKGGLVNRLLQARLAQMFKPIQESLADELSVIFQSGGMDQIAEARAKGLLRIESSDPGTATDLLVSCVRSAKLNGEGQPNDPEYTDRMVETFIGKLSDHLSLGREYVIFDQPIADLTKAAIEAGLFEPASGPAGRSAQGMTASELMGQLPTFPNASVDEVLDIRSELSPALTRFRSEMVTLSKGFKTESWEKGFTDNVHDAWVENVEPAVEIDAAVRENKSLLTIASDATAALKGTLPGLAIVGAGHEAHSSSLAITGGAVSATGALLQALRERKDQTTRIKMQPFYFLYALDRRLS
jgi:hypothetical protein